MFRPLHWCGPICPVRTVDGRERSMVLRREYADNTQHCTDRAPLWGEAVLLVRDYSTPMSVERAREWWRYPGCGEPVPHSPSRFGRSGADFKSWRSTPRRFESGCGVEIPVRLFS